ncbi:hypothetical protein RJ639_015453 [Escallonia herrerae]|uniref:Ycf2 N-terminal domain-containing protein n=1 Tax=Escallonia herrerae TaxID=1293975 RepID=A0AA88VF77_9ASTE|nr:hypothetical protein RJ639_015453 [Escallonia herrerae]
MKRFIEMVSPFISMRLRSPNVWEFLLLNLFLLVDGYLVCKHLLVSPISSELWKEFEKITPNVDLNGQ